MGRTCTICRYKDRDEVDRALVAGEPLRSVLARFPGLSKTSLSRHAADHIPAALVRAVAAREEVASLDLMTRLRDQCAFGDKLRAACERWLADPDAPERFEIGLRSDDVDVLYRERSGNGWVQKRAKLSRLLAMVEGEDVRVDRGEMRYADPRELAVKILNAQSRQSELIGKALGKIGDGAGVSGAELARVQSVVIAALAPYPDARAAVLAALHALDDEHGRA
jgi:hypothetical protein